jgi:hypothetical protein
MKKLALEHLIFFLKDAKLFDLIDFNHAESKRFADHLKCELCFFSTYFPEGRIRRLQIRENIFILEKLVFYTLGCEFGKARIGQEGDLIEESQGISSVEELG